MRTRPYAQGNAIRQPADLGSETPFAHNKLVTDQREYLHAVIPYTPLHLLLSK